MLHLLGAALFGRAINAQQLASRSQPASKDRFKRVGRCVPPLFCRIRGAVGKEKGRLKSRSPSSSMPITGPGRDSYRPRERSSPAVCRRRSQAKPANGEAAMGGEDSAEAPGIRTWTAKAPACHTHGSQHGMPRLSFSLVSLEKLSFDPFGALP